MPGTEQQDRTDSGALFQQREKKTDKSPDFTGRIQLSDKLLRELVAQRQQGEVATVHISGWKRFTKQNIAFLSLKVKINQEPSQDPFGQPTQYSQPPQAPAWVEGPPQQTWPPQQQSAGQNDLFGAPVPSGPPPGRRPW